jgi:hypothetical protein
MEHCGKLKATITVFIISMPVRTSGFKSDIERKIINFEKKRNLNSKRFWRKLLT